MLLSWQFPTSGTLCGFAVRCPFGFALPATICKYVITSVALVVTAVRAKRPMIQVDLAMPYGVSSTFHILHSSKVGDLRNSAEHWSGSGKVFEVAQRRWDKVVAVLLSEWCERFGTRMLVPLRCRGSAAAVPLRPLWCRCTVLLEGAVVHFGAGILVPLPGAAAGCCLRALLSKGGARALGAGMRVPLQVAAAGCGCKALLEGAAIRVVCALWSKHAGTIARCLCKVCWE